MNDDLISRSALLEDIDFDREAAKVHPQEICELFNRFCDYAEELVEDAPAVEAEPVRLRVEKGDIVELTGWYRKRFYCPCGQLIRTESWDEKRCFGQSTILKENVMPNYCPMCGAKMDGDKDAEEVPD